MQPLQIISFKIRKGKEMSKVTALLAGSIVLLSVLGFAAFSTPRAVANSTNQTSPPDNGQTMQALLSEVHQLRLAIQQSNLSTYRAQVTLERLRLQQQRVDRINDKLGEIRKEIAGYQQGDKALTEESKRLDAEIVQEADPNRRRELENVRQHQKSRLDQLTQMAGQARETESQLISQLQIEQSKLNDLNDQLDTLQKELEGLDKTPQGGKRP